MDVAQEREREIPRLGELGMGEMAVSADRQQDSLTLAQRAGDLAQVGELRCSDGAPVETVEGQHNVGLPPEL
jgi:hypothetical protein